LPTNSNGMSTKPRYLDDQLRVRLPSPSFLVPPRPYILEPSLPPLYRRLPYPRSWTPLPFSFDRAVAQRNDLISTFIFPEMSKRRRIELSSFLFLSYHLYPSLPSGQLGANPEFTAMVALFVAISQHLALLPAVSLPSLSMRAVVMQMKPTMRCTTSALVGTTS